jgi:Short C-terminal domain
VLFLIILPYIWIFAYILTQSRSMSERNELRAKQAGEELRQTAGFSAADEIEKLQRLKSAGVISEQEYMRLKAQVMQ